MARIRVFRVVGNSMRPTLSNGDIVISFGNAKSIKRGDIVAFHNPVTGNVSIKRVASLTGELVTVLGDNRADSLDSRHFGPVARLSIIGVVRLRIWPLDRRSMHLGNVPTRHWSMPL